VAQGEVLQSQLAVAAAEEREESEHVEQRGDHGARFSPGQRRKSIDRRRNGILARDSLDQMVVLNETHPRRLLRDYLAYYHSVRTHLSLDKNSPEPRAVERPDQGGIVAMPMVGGLHHRYTRLTA